MLYPINVIFPGTGILHSELIARLRQGKSYVARGCISIGKFYIRQDVQSIATGIIAVVNTIDHCRKIVLLDVKRVVTMIYYGHVGNG
jgi:hypothetical protein